MENFILWRVSIQHYDFTKNVTAKMSYGYYRKKPEDTVIKNTGPCRGWTEINFFHNKDDAKECMLKVDEELFQKNDVV